MFTIITTLLLPLWTKYQNLIIIGVLVVGVCGGGFVYFRITQAQIAHLQTKVGELTVETADLKATNAHLISDMLMVKAQEEKTNAAIVTARTNAQKARDKIQTNDFKSPAEAANAMNNILQGIVNETH